MRIGACLELKVEGMLVDSERSDLYRNCALYMRTQSLYRASKKETRFLLGPTSFSGMPVIPRRCLAKMNNPQKCSGPGASSQGPMTIFEAAIGPSYSSELAQIASPTPLDSLSNLYQRDKQ